MKRGFLHYLSMFVVLLGGITLLAFSAVWYTRANVLMSLGMLDMGIIALANFYLHLNSMRRNKK